MAKSEDVPAQVPAPGSQAPDFTLPDDSGNQVRLSDFRGQRVVLYFYPKDESPGCTKEACSFRDARQELAKLAPEIEARLGPLSPNPPLPPNEERLRLFDHVTRFLQRLAAGRGLLLFLDDLHWADHGTIALLHYLMRRLRNDRVLVLAAYRESELDRSRPLSDALVEWNRERLASRLLRWKRSRPLTPAARPAVPASEPGHSSRRRD